MFKLRLLRSVHIIFDQLNHIPYLYVVYVNINQFNVDTRAVRIIHVVYT
jgi:hypothetical protein